MKIIFDSEEQKDRMLHALAGELCPFECFNMNMVNSEGPCINNEYTCRDCWENAGIEYEIIGETKYLTLDSLFKVTADLNGRVHMNEIELPERKPVLEMDIIHSESIECGYYQGWNDCLDTILGKEKENGI